MAAATAIPAKPWEQQPGETPNAYRAALIFFGLGPGRTLQETSARYFDQKAGVSAASARRRKPESKRPGGQIYAWSAEHEWVARAAAFDGEKLRLEREAVERAAAAERADWQKKMAQKRRDGWDLSAALKVKAVQMLEWPLERTTATETDAAGNVVAVTREPARWTMRDAALFLKTASEIEADVERSLGPHMVPAEPAPPDPAEASPDGRVLPTVTSVLVRLSSVDDRGAHPAGPEPAGPPPGP